MHRLSPVPAVLSALVALTAGLLAAPPSAQAADPPIVSGWFGDWTSAADMIGVARGSEGVLGEVSIFWWHYRGSSRPVCVSGASSCSASSARPWATTKQAEALQGLHRQGILVFGTHTDLWSGNAGSLSNYLASPSNRDAIAQRLTDWTVGAGLDGVDLDWENFAFNDGSSTWRRTRPRLNDTVRRLAAKLHAKGKLLSVTVPGGYQPFLSNGRPNPGGGYTVYSWKVLGRYVDRLRLMTYDYSWNRPGPIGPQPWAASSVRSAIAQVGSANRKKVYVGLHQYGKAWYSRDASDDYITVGKCNDRWVPSGSDSIALSPAEAVSVARTYGTTPRLDPVSDEYTFSYVKSESGSWWAGGKRRTATCRVRKEIWFGGRATAVARAKLVKNLDIGGMAIWQLATLPRGFFNALDPYVAPSRSARRKLRR